MRFRATRLAFLPFLLVATPADVAAKPVPAACGALTASPDQVPIGLLYDGVAIEVRASVPSGSQAAVRLVGERDELVLKRKAKRGGILWMNAGEVSFEGIPVVYQLLTSAPLAELGSAELLAEMQLGYEWLVPAEDANASLRDELVKLKERDGLYGISERGLAEPEDGAKLPTSPASGCEAGDEPQTELAGVVRLPALAPPGDYQVELIAFSGGQASSLGSAPVRLERAGVVRAMYRLAMDHGLLYGCLAVIVAILAGLFTGLIFKSKSSEPH